MSSVRSVLPSISFLCLSGCYYNDIKIDIVSDQSNITIQTEFVSYSGDFVNNEFIIDSREIAAEKIKKIVSDSVKIEAECKSLPAIHDFAIFNEPWRYESSEKRFKSFITFNLTDVSSQSELGQLAACVFVSTGYIAGFDNKELENNTISGLFIAGFSENKKPDGTPAYSVDALKKAGILGLGEVCISEKFSSENSSHTKDSNILCRSISVYEETTFVQFTER